MKKRILSAFLCLCMMLTMAPSALAYDQWINTPNGDTALTATYSNGQSSTKTRYFDNKNNDDYAAEDAPRDHIWDVIAVIKGYEDLKNHNQVEITLNKDITLEDTTILVENGFNVTIKGEGHIISAALTGAIEAGENGAHKPGMDAVSIIKGGSLTLDNVTLNIYKTNSDTRAVNATQGIYNDGTLTLTNDAKVSVNDVSQGGINGSGSINLESNSTFSASNVGGTAIKGASLTANDAAITVTGAEYYGISVDEQNFTDAAVTITSSGTAKQGYPAVWAKNFCLSGGTMDLTNNRPDSAEMPSKCNIVSINGGSATVADGTTLTGGIETKAGTNSSITVTGATVTGGVNNNGTGKVSVISSAVGSVEGDATIVDSTIAGNKVEDQVQEGVVAVYNGATYTSLKAAVDDAVKEDAPNSAITLIADASLTEKITITKNVTIVGNGKTITGKTDSTEVYFEITGGTLNISDAKLTGFGDTAETQPGFGVFKIPSTAKDAQIAASGLTVEMFNRAAFDVRNGKFDIKNCIINCDNGQAKALTKGIVAGYEATGVVTGKVEGCTITGSNSTYEGWSSNGIEISAGAAVTISNTEINSMKGGISVARNYGHGEADVTLENCTVTGKDYALRIFESNNSSKPVEGSSAKLTVQGGTYTGDVRISRKDNDPNGENNSNSSTVTVTSGTFDSSVAQYADTSLKYEAVAADGKKFTYHKTAEEAIAAAGNGGNISLIVGASAGKFDTVTLDYGYDNIKSTVEVLAGEKLTLPAADRSGYSFQGWYLNNSKIMEYTATQEGGKDITITAQWSKNGGSSGGSGGSGGSAPSSYTVSVSSASNGSVSVSPKNASKGDTVTITVKPDTGYELDTLTVTDKDGSRISVADKGNNKYTFTMPSGKVTVKATFAKVGEQPQPGISFTDVSTSDYYYDAVKWAVEKDITSGTSTTKFSPDASCTRAQMVTFLWRANGSPKATGANPFTDVQTGSYYYDAVLWAVENDITSGISATTFAPDATVTRGQTVTFLHRANGSPAVSGSNPFTDVVSSAYYAAAVQWAVENDVTSGASATTFAPDAPCTRAQIVTFLYRDMA